MNKWLPDDPFPFIKEIETKNRSEYAEVTEMELELSNKAKSDMQIIQENEIYDLFVRPEAANRGYELELIVKAVALNGPHPMMVLVDVDAKKEIETYSEAGFEVLEGYNSVLASCKKS